MKFIRSAVFGIALSLLICLQVGAQITDPHPAIGIVGQGSGRGTGTLICYSQNPPYSLVITAKHVASSRGSAYFKPNGTQRRWQSRRVIDLPSADVSMLVIDSAGLENRTPMKMWTGNLTAGMESYSEGYGGMKGIGRLKGAYEKSFGGADGEFSMPAIPGDSGSAVFHVYRKQPFLIAIVSGSNWPDFGGKTATWTAAPTVRVIRPWLNRMTVGGAQVKLMPTGEVKLIPGTQLEIDVGGTLQGRNWPQPYDPGQDQLEGFRGQQQICPPGGGPCPPQRQQQQPQGQLPQINPPPQQQQQQQQPGCPCPPRNPNELLLGGKLRVEIDIDEVVEKILERISKDDRFKGPKGEDGKDGKDGADGTLSQQEINQIVQVVTQQVINDPGSRGPAGPPGESPDVDSIVDQVISKLPQTPITVVDPKTGEEQPLATLEIGRPLRIAIPWVAGTPDGDPQSRFVSHVVVVGDDDGRLQDEIKAAQSKFRRVIVLPKSEIPPRVIINQTPTAVVYAGNGDVVGMFEGAARVERLLSSISKGEYP